MVSESRPSNAEKRQELGEADKIDLLCDVFEQACAADEQPKIEDYLERCEASAREALLEELLLVDCELRAKRGENVTSEMYERRFPGYSKVMARLPWETIGKTGDSHLVATSSALIAGSRVAHFELLEEIGRGAFGIVWRARDDRLGRIVAVKFPRQERLSASERERFVREGRAAAKLRHPNIVTLFDVGEDQRRAFIISELVEGANLRQWLDDRQPTARVTAELVAQLAEALHHAHEQGVIHRDMKPANVLVDRDGRPHITDFGLAKMTSDSTMTLEGHILGTPAYMSPEQASGDLARIDRRTDVYGLGAVLYELLTVQPPFTGDAASIVHQVIHVEPRKPRKIVAAVPRDLETICLKAMEKEPRRRYPSAQEMAVDLRRYLRGESIIARRANVLEKSWRWLRRRPATASAIILPLMVLVAASAVIKSISDENYRQQGYQRVQVITNPPGARIAIVPIDRRTGEPNISPGAVIDPREKTPLTVYLKPDDYFVEAIISGEEGILDIAEVYQTVLPPELLRRSDMKRNKYDGREERSREVKFNIDIKPTADIIADMVPVLIDHDLRQKNPLLPELLYVDRKETTPREVNRAGASKDGQRYIVFETAKQELRAKSKRMPSAAEYDAIIQAVTDGQLKKVASGAKTTVEDLFTGLAEWTTTKYDFPGAVEDRNNVEKLNNMYLLKGYGDPEKLPGLLRFVGGVLLAPPDSHSPLIGFRGVRSGAAFCTDPIDDGQFPFENLLANLPPHLNQGWVKCFSQIKAWRAPPSSYFIRTTVPLVLGVTVVAGMQLGQ